MRPTDALPIAIDQNLGPGGTGASSITGMPWARAMARMAPRSQGMPIWWAQRMALVRAVMASSSSAGSRLKVVGGTPCAYVVGAGDEGEADGHDLIARADAHGLKRQAKTHGTVADRAGMGGTDKTGEFSLEGLDLGALGQPAREQDGTRRLGLVLADERLCNGNHGHETKGIGVQCLKIDKGGLGEGKTRRASTGSSGAPAGCKLPSRRGG